MFDEMGNTIIACSFPPWTCIDPQPDSRRLWTVVFCGHSHTIFECGDLSLWDIHAGWDTWCHSRLPAIGYLCKTMWVRIWGYSICAPCLALTWVTPDFNVKAFKGVWIVNKRDAILKNPYNLNVIDVKFRVYAPRTEST